MLNAEKEMVRNMIQVAVAKAKDEMRAEFKKELAEIRAAIKALMVTAKSKEEKKE